MVAMNVWPTDAADGSVSNEARWRKMARQWMRSGVIDNVGGEMAPTLAFPNLTVQAGAAWVDGHYTELLGAQVLAVTANGIVVVRLDPAANTAQLLYRDGATVPTQTDGGIWEILIAQISGSALLDKRDIPVGPADTIGARIDGGYASVGAHLQAAAGTVLLVPLTALPFPTRMFVSGWACAGSDSGALLNVITTIYTQVAGTNSPGSPGAAGHGASQFGYNPLAYSWLVPAGGIPTFEANTAWTVGAGSVYTAANLTWHRYRL